MTNKSRRLPALVSAVVIGLLAAAAMPTKAHAYDEWSAGCKNCHGDFNSGTYTSKSDATSWGTDLMQGHENFMGSNACNICHQPPSGTPRSPVYLGLSAGITGYSPISCLGCHGRPADATGACVVGDASTIVSGNCGMGAGLRKHHVNSGVTGCPLCHTDGTPSGENIKPTYYFADSNRPNKPVDPCSAASAPGSENKFGLTGLDNDGDLLYESADPDCTGVITGTSGPDNLFGTAGNDTIDGKAGADVMTGLAGNDTYIVDNTGDAVVEALDEGVDLIKTSVTYTLPVNVENMTLTGAGIINGTGNGLANSLVGNAANNILDGKAGTDTMSGKAGNDTYYVDIGSDRVIEGVDQGTDTVRSNVSHTLRVNVENLVLTGTAAINGTGNTLSNRLTGNGVNNTLNGGLGNDTLTGGAGLDRFLFNTAPDTSTNYDRITDFNPVDDTIRLENLVFTGLPTTGTLAADAFATGVAATTAAHRIIYDPATGNVRYDADGNGPAAAVRFALLTTKPVLTNADFWVQ